MRLWAIVLSLCAGCPFCSSLFQKKKICVSNWPFWSVRREHYTIGKSGLKHRERQNSLSWAHKLHWCGIIWSFACGASLPSPCAVRLPSYHLSYPQLTSKCTVFSHIHDVLLCISFVLFFAAVCFRVKLNAVTSYFLVLHYVFLFSAASQSFGSQTARLADWRVSGGSLLDPIGWQSHKSELPLCFAPPHWDTHVTEKNYRHADFLARGPIKVWHSLFCAIPQRRDELDAWCRRNICKTVDINERLTMKVCMKDRWSQLLSHAVMGEKIAKNHIRLHYPSMTVQPSAACIVHKGSEGQGLQGEARATAARHVVCL